MGEISPVPELLSVETKPDSSTVIGWRRVEQIVLLGALSAFGPLSIDMYLPSLPSLSHDLGASASAAQLTLSACLLGLAFGQVVAGPISDTWGRRRPLLIGMAVYAIASLLCFLAPSISLLIALRLVQGAAGAVGIVISRAIVRDLYSGLEVTRFFSRLTLISGIAPIVAPLLGGFLLHFTSWRGVFLVLTGIGILLLLAVALSLKETLPLHLRQSGGLHTTFITFRTLLTNRLFVVCALSCGLAFAALFSYISGSPFVLQDIYGLSPQLFSLVFGMNALGIAVAGQINGLLVGRLSTTKLLAGGLGATALGGVALLLVVNSHIGLVGILPALFIVVASIGIITPNATSLAMADYPHIAGSASALLGVLQFSIGSVAAPLVGVDGSTTALPMALLIAVFGGSAFLIFLLFGQRRGMHRN